MLLTIENIEFQLYSKFSIFDGEMDDLILKRRKSPICDFEFVAKKLNVKLPSEFLLFLKKYDVDNFSIGNVAFGSGSDYLNKIVAINDDRFNHWWIGNERPQGVIVIASSDPYTILLNTINCKVYAIMSEEMPSDAQPIAADFNLFFRGVASAFLKACSRNEIERLVDSKNGDFWADI